MAVQCGGCFNVSLNTALSFSEDLFSAACFTEQPLEKVTGQQFIVHTELNRQGCFIISHMKFTHIACKYLYSKVNVC